MKNLNLLSILLFASIAFVSCDNSANQNQFTLLSSNDTGVDFTNQLNEDNEINYCAFLASMLRVA